MKSVQIRTRKNFVYGQFSCSDYYLCFTKLLWQSIPKNLPHENSKVPHCQWSLSLGKACSKFKVKTIKSYPANIYFFKVNNRNTRKRSEICSKLIVNVSWVNIVLNVFKVKNKDVAVTLLDVIAVPSLLTLDIFSLHCFSFSNFEHIFVCSKIFLHAVLQCKQNFVPEWVRSSHS